MNKINKSLLSLSLAVMTISGVVVADDALDGDYIILDEAALANATGRENLQEQKSDVNQAATLGDNVLTAGETGSNVISSNSFTDLQGIAHVIQNSGNNVIIQDSTTFNVQFVPGAVN